MTPEEKLNHLRGYMDGWIEWKAKKINYVKHFWEVRDLVGIILPSSMLPDYPTFEQYLQSIK